jgi:DNA-binding protein HU-beta
MVAMMVVSNRAGDIAPKLSDSERREQVTRAKTLEGNDMPPAKKPTPAKKVVPAAKAAAPTKKAAPVAKKAAPAPKAAIATKKVAAPLKKSAPVGKKAAAPAGKAGTKAAPQITVTLKQIAAELAEAHDLPKKQAEAVLGELVALTTRHLKNGDKIRLTGLGILLVQKRAPRMGRNPATGAAIQIAASQKIAFRPSKELKETV